MVELVIVPYDAGQPSEVSRTNRKKATSHAAWVSRRSKKPSRNAEDAEEWWQPGACSAPFRVPNRKRPRHQQHVVPVYRTPMATSHDPFNALPCPVNPTIQQLFSYWADPSSWGCLFGPAKSSLHGRMLRISVRHTLQQLIDPIKAPALLLQQSALVCAMLPNLKMQVTHLRYKQSTISLLRTMVESDNYDLRVSVDVMLCALEGALYVGEMTETQLHLRQLRILLNTLDEQIEVKSDPILVLKLGTIFFFDWIFALKGGVIPVLTDHDLPPGLREVLRGHTARNDELLAQPCEEIRMDNTLSSEVVEILHQWRRVLKLAVTGNEANADPSRTLWLASLIGQRLLTPIIDMVNRVSQKCQNPNGSQVQSIVELMLLASIMLHSSMCWHVIKPLGQFSIDNGVAQKLKFYVPLIQQRRQSEQFHELQLWSLYIAACWEITYLTNHTGQWEACFVEMLRQKAEQIQIKDWRSASCVLAKWLPISNVYPNGVSWFDELMLRGHLDMPVRGVFSDRCWKAGCPRGE